MKTPEEKVLAQVLHFLETEKLYRFGIKEYWEKEQKHWNIELSRAKLEEVEHIITGLPKTPNDLDTWYANKILHDNHL